MWRWKKEREWSDRGGSVLRRKGEITWEKYCFLYAKSRLSRISLGKVNVDNAIITKEIIVLEKILSMVQEIKYKKKIPTILADTDSIICINKENIVFNFDGNRIYNSWLSDESPKVVFKDEKISVFEEEYFIKITEKRKVAINKCLKEKINEEVFREICIKANQSDFLIGENDRNWKADFDFVTRSDKAMQVLEGKYENRQKSNNVFYQLGKEEGIF